MQKLIWLKVLAQDYRKKPSPKVIKLFCAQHN